MLLGIQDCLEGNDRLVLLNVDLPVEVGGNVDVRVFFSEKSPAQMLKIIQNKSTSHVFLQLADGDVLQLLLKPGPILHNPSPDNAQMRNLLGFPPSTHTFPLNALVWVLSR